MSIAVDQQQTPQNPPQGVPTWDLVRMDLDARRRRQERPTPVLDAVYEEAGERDRMGREKYGVPLMTNNGRDSLVDAYQESMDLAVYLRNFAAEAGSFPSDITPRQLYDDAVFLMLRLRALIFKRDGR
jgi:hypothetical protein